MEREKATAENDCYLCCQASIFVRHSHEPRKPKEDDELTRAIREQARLFSAIYTDSSKLEPLELAVPQPNFPTEDEIIPKHVRDVISSIYVEKLVR